MRRISDPASAAPRRRLRPALARGAGATALVTALSLPAVAAGQTAYLSSSNGVVTVDTVSGRLLRPPAVQGDGSVVGAGRPTAISGDGRTVYLLLGTAVVPVDTAANRAEAPIVLATGPGGRGDSIAVTPDDATVLTTSELGDAVTPIATATKRAGTPIAVESPTAIAVAPDGATAYVTTRDGTLTPIDLSTRRVGTPIALAHTPSDVAVTPDGALAIVVETDTATSLGFVQVVDLGTGVAESPVATGDRPVSSLVLAPDGRTAYVNEPPLPPREFDTVPADEGHVVPFAVQSRTVGARLPLRPGLSWAEPRAQAVSGDSASVFVTIPCTDGHCIGGRAFVFDVATAASRDLDYSPPTDFPPSWHPEGIVLAPDPSAGFIVTPGQPGALSILDAGASSNAGGTVSGYTWSFGDGSPAVITPGPTVSHVYAQPGRYTATLTTTNQGGCASVFRYTGRMASCTGSPIATTSRTVTITAPPPPPPAAGPATAHTGDAGDIRATRALVRGTIDVAGASANWRFEYGTSPRYGRSTAAQTVPAQRGRVPVQSRLTGLAPNRRYHYRLVVETPGRAGVSRGGDESFVTPANGALRLRSRRLAVVRGAVGVPLRCDSRANCNGRLVLSIPAARCATATVRVGARRTARPQLALSSACRTKLRDSRRQWIGAQLIGTFSSGQKSFTRSVRLTR